MSEDRIVIPVMPKATAVWLVENTTLTFQQIADFCDMHPLEVQGIADGEVAVGIIGKDPVGSGQLSRDEIVRCELDETAVVQVLKSKNGIESSRRRGKRYIPPSRRIERPNAISWLIKYHPDLRDPQIARLLGTTKTTIVSVRERTHHNIINIKPQDPVLLGICKQVELEAEVLRAAKAKANKKPPKATTVDTKIVE